MKVCLGCDQVKALTDYTPVRNRPGQYYPSCSVCRNEKARARYYNSPEVQTAEIARAQRNRVKRQAA